MRRHSLTARLSLLVALTSVLVAAAAGTWSYVRALQEARDLQDDVLVQVGSIAAASTAATGPQVDGIPLADTLSDIDVTTLSDSGLPASTPDGLGTADLDGTYSRIFVLRSLAGTQLVVSQSVEVRDEVARSTAFAAVMPALALAPVLVLAIFLVVRRVLHPVDSLAAEVRGRAPTNLGPLALDDAPEELKEFLAALNAQFAQVDIALERERLFIAKAAHELRTPLTAMSLQLERASIAPDSSHLRERLADLRLGVERSRHLVNQLLDLAQAQAGAPGPRSLQRLDAIVRDVVADLLPLADEAGVELDVDLADAGQEMLAGTAMTSILRNLLDNAIRYSGPAGRVHLGARTSAEHLTIVVDDNGPGIGAPERMVLPFTREAGQEIQGSGLGLAVVAEQALRLHGRLELLPSSRYPHGTQARITIQR